MPTAPTPSRRTSLVEVGGGLPRPPDYSAAAPNYDGHFRPRRQRYRNRWVEAPFRALASGRLLEIGCGTGRLLSGLGASVIGIDASAEMIVHALRRGFSVVQADAHALPFADHTFDGVIAAKGVLRYTDINRALAEMSRVLCPGGAIAVHRYGEPVSVRRRRGAAPEPAGLDRAARRAGLLPVMRKRWRTLPFFPYITPLPRWAPQALWSHEVALWKKPPGRGT